MYSFLSPDIMSTSGYTTDVDLGLFDYNKMVEAQMDEVHISSRSVLREKQREIKGPLFHQHLHY